MADSVPVPRVGERNVLVTSALPYVNNVPHLGNCIGAVLSADVYARYLKQRGVTSIFVCGTDEYGTATETKAQEEGLTPRQICDKYHALHKEIYDWFEIEFDHFGRTSTEKQTEICQAIFWDNYNNGYVEEGTMDQLYCVKDDRFLADRYVRGECPHCGAEDARGDQCDNCSKLLNPTDLIRPYCHTCGTTPEIRTVKHLFLKLPSLEEELNSWVKDASVKGNWSANAVSMTRTWLDGGLRQRCITRDLKWGTPVPLEGFTDKVFYVWFDAPIGYLSITAALTDKWVEWWQPDPASGVEVELVQFMGKDNIPFHSVIFPCTQLGTKKPWTMVHHLATTEYLNYEDGKFSKSRGIGVFGNDARDTGIPVEVWRYYLLVNRPETADAVFSWTDLQAKTNDELLANIGNLANRTLTFLKKSFKGKMPAVVLSEDDRSFADQVNAELLEYNKAMNAVSLKAGLKRATAISRIANQYLQKNEPWKVVRSDPARGGSIIAFAANVLFLVARVLRPFMGSSFADRILAMLGVPLEESNLAIPDELMFELTEGAVAGQPQLLFKELEDKQIVELREKFSGNQAERLQAAEAKANGADDSGAFRLDLRVGRIVEAGTVEGSDKLYLCKVDVGEVSGPRQVVAGLRDMYSIEDLQGRQVVLVCNLQPASLAGHESQGMILVAEKKKATRILECPGANPGDAVSAGNLVLVREPLLDRKGFQTASKGVRVGANQQLVFDKQHVLAAGERKHPVLSGGVAEGGKVK
eukprot:Plantae.Rhodophyta-Rhodochaete_pulchella.ctg1074.p1 GENE.Plantae.Rhodophyta-Rhodochaete_pulchella.ctg1074~~Plantae.Rhodophyta-Rhodochaete_pulchella.ctg1074.p1  ORF type:complete len:754 (-),score=133.53 Plantae.Rhodophyta-Rhodochaete_pulchella.ctg1074:82-2343(-)